MKKSLAKRSTERRVAYFFLLINTLCWGAALILVKPALSVTTPIRYLLYRFILAAFFSWPFLIYYLPKVKKLGPTLAKIVLIELIGIALALPILYIGLSWTSAIQASLLGTTGPIFVVIAGVLILKEKQQSREWLGLLMALLGTLLITLVPILQNGGWSNQTTTAPELKAIAGNILIIVYNVIIAFYCILAKKHYHRLPKLFVSSISFYVGIVAFLMLSLVEVGFSATAYWASVVGDLKSVWVWVAAVYMGLFGSVIGLTAYIKGQDGVEASEASIFWYLQPLVYLPLGLVVLGEKIGVVQVVGLAVVLAGVWVAGRRK